MLAALLVLLGAQGAVRSQADTAPVPPLPATVSTDALPTAQINGVVWTQLVVGDIVYAGGNFTQARPAGAAAGTQSVNRANLLAYNVKTGVLVPSFAPNLNGQVKSLAVSPDGATLYVAGTFTTVNNLTRNRLAAFSVSTGALLSFAPDLNSIAYGIAVSDTTVYVGGTFSSVNNVTRQRFAAVDRISGATRPLVAAVDNGSVRQVALSPDQTKVVIGGNFSSVGGSTNPGYGLAMLNATTGAALPMPVNATVRNARDNAAIYSLVSAPDGFYGSAYAFSKVDGNLEGAFKADWNGNLIWVQDCHGDTYSVFPSGGVLYAAGHPHYCGNVGGFPQTDPKWMFQRGIAFSAQATGVLRREQYGYFNFEGQPSPTLLNWFPDINTGTFTGQTQGPWSISGNNDYVVYGGEFTQVNGVNQQGLVRFAKRSLAPNTDGPRLSGSALVPQVRSYSPGIRVSWPANFDRDNETLSYDLIRNGNLASPVWSATRVSTFWRRPNLAFLDTTVTPGVTYDYRVRTTDPLGNTTLGDAISVVAGGGPGLSAVDQAALADGPGSAWLLNETTGTSAVDTAGTDPATRSAGVVTGVPGLTNDPGTAYRFPGASNGFLSTTGTAKVAPQVFSVEAWFKTSSTLGGKIIGYGSSSSGNSSSSDRQLYLTNTGRIYFGVYPGTIRTLNSDPGFNNGQWHHVVGTLQPSGMALYVDGQPISARTDTGNAQIYNGFWRIGGDTLTSWPNNPTSAYFAGDIDNPAVYPAALTAAQVHAHYAARTGAPPANQPPTAAFTRTPTQLTAALDASASTDPDGTIVGYSWAFGDATTGTGKTVSHTYAMPGTYPVTLTVTDDDGATGVSTQNVTVTAPPPPEPRFVADQFNRTQATGLGPADLGGTWTVNGDAGFGVAGGAGLVKLSTPGVTRTALLAGTQHNNTDLRANLTLDKAATGGGIFLTVQGRRVAANTEYRTVVRLNNAGLAYVTLEAAQGGSAVTVLTSPVALPGTLAVGDQIHIRAQVFGASPTTIRSKVWIGSAPEPAEWMATATDNFAALQAPGSVGLVAYMSSAATNAPVTVSVLDVEARPAIS
ncbi:MAG TPA: LamG-like jellyroll fold domain-containing protein [Propionibacteriaceae bacterium]